uniref:Uncharacterized protein n=1 Tax=Sphaerodactylus townsendi TaxID=933632 RepID=A0ACB8F7G3_9SAUR
MDWATLDPRDESTEGKLEVPTHCDRHCFKDGPIGNGPIGQRSSSITPERMKDFGEEDYLNGGVKTWEMKIVSHSEELLRDLPIRPERVSLTAHNKCIRFEDISAAAFKIQCGVQKTPCMSHGKVLGEYVMLSYSEANHRISGIPCAQSGYELSRASDFQHTCYLIAF